MMLAVLTLAVGYLRWKSTHFQRPSEIEESITRSYSNYRVFEDANLIYTVVGVLAEKPGFPKQLYKYVPLVEREGFVDVQLAILPYNKDRVSLPSPEEIEGYDLFPSDKIEIRNVTWSDKPVQDANIQLRIYYLKDRYVINVFTQQWLALLNQLQEKLTNGTMLSLSIQISTTLKNSRQVSDELTLYIQNTVSAKTQIGCQLTEQEEMVQRDTDSREESVSRCPVVVFDLNHNRIFWSIRL